MSWKISGIFFNKNYEGKHDLLLNTLGISYANSANGFTFQNAINRDLNVTALGPIDKGTLLLNRFLAYDCSNEISQLSDLDVQLCHLSLDCDVLAFIIDGSGNWFSFYMFNEGFKTRIWASSNGIIISDEGLAHKIELEFTNKKKYENLPFVLQPDDSEIYVWHVLEKFGNFDFQVQYNLNLADFTFYL